MRFPTGIKIDSTKDIQGKYVHWDYKNSRLKLPTATGTNYLAVQNLKIQQKTIDDTLFTANNLINEYFSFGAMVYPDWLKSQLEELERKKLLKADTGFLEYFNEFLERKKNQFASRGNIISLKDYVSTKLLLEDFEHYKNTNIQIPFINVLWLEELVQYMSIKHESHYGEHKVSSQGEMANSTIKKRLDILAEFFSFLKEMNVVTSNQVDVIKNFKKTIKREATHKETLDIAEIHKLYKFKFTNKQHELVRDLFVFLCLTGIRYQDLFDFDSRFIRNSKDGDGLFYQRKAAKTGIDYNVPLCKIVIEILEKYEYKLPKITGQYGNKKIKELLRETDLFNDPTQIKDKKTKKYKKRYEAITLHKGRNSFITNLVDTTPLNELMKYTGHKKLSTLQSYIDAKRPVKMDYIKIFDM